jgi:chromosome segregation ATPase
MFENPNAAAILTILLSSSVLVSLITAISAHWGKKKERQAGYVDGRINDLKEQTSKNDREIGDLRKELKEARDETKAALERLARYEKFAAAQEQYTASLRINVQELCPGATMPPMPHLER